MKLPNFTKKTGGVSLRLLLLGIVFAFVPLILLAQTPAWWSQRGVSNGNPANDYAAVNQGQVKNIATAAIAELNADLPGGAGPILNQLAITLSSTSAKTNDYAAVNLGQVKAISKPLFDRLLTVGYQGHPLESGTYPWFGKESTANDYAMANIGQVKNLFSFDLTLTGTNGLPDWWQKYYFGGVVPDANVSAPSGILLNGTAVTILQAYENHLNPIDFYNGEAPTLAITNGNDQTGSPGCFVSNPLVVRVTGTSGTLVNAPVVFSVPQGAGLLSNSVSGTLSLSATIRTDTSGCAIIYLKLPNGPSRDSQITCVAGTANQLALVTFTEHMVNFGSICWYVNSIVGSNDYSGLYANVIPGPDGPKQTISAALAAASSNDTLEISAGTYTETELHLGSRTIHLTPNGTVNVQ